MMCMESDQQIYDLHINYHAGAFVDCGECGAIISVVDKAIEAVRDSTVAEMKVAYEPRRPTTDMPTPIDATPEDIAWAVLNTAPKKNWRYMNRDSDNPQPAN